MQHLYIIAALAACASLIAAYYRTGRALGLNPDAGEASHHDSPQTEFLTASTRPLVELVQSALQHIGAEEDSSEVAYQAALIGLRSQPECAAQALVAGYQALSAADYLGRWCHIQLLVELSAPSSLPFLQKVLGTPMPDSDAAAPVRTQETILRTTALEAITRMASAGNLLALRDSSRAALARVAVRPPRRLAELSQARRRRRHGSPADTRGLSIANLTTLQ